MFTYLIIFGVGACTFLIDKELSGVYQEKTYMGIIQYIFYTVINLVITYLCLHSMGRVTIVETPDKLYEIIYGPSGIIFSFLTSIILGVVFAFIHKYVKINIDVKEEDK